MSERRLPRSENPYISLRLETMRLLRKADVDISFGSADREIVSALRNTFSLSPMNLWDEEIKESYTLFRESLYSTLIELGVEVEKPELPKYDPINPLPDPGLPHIKKGLYSIFSTEKP